MNASPATRGDDGSRGLHRIATGSTVGLAAGVVGLVLPVTLLLLANYSPGTLLLTPAQLIQVTAILALAGALLFAISLLLYRFGFSSLRASDRRFWVASGLCMLGTVGIVLILVPIVVALTSSDPLVACLHGALTKAPACLRSSAPLASYAAVVGFWLLWLGGLGVVVGLGLASGRFRQAWLSAGAVLYAILLLGLVAPVLGLLVPIGGLEYPILALPVLVLLAPLVTSHGCHRVMSTA